MLAEPTQLIEHLEAARSRFLAGKQSRPFVTLAFAQSFDGCLSTMPGERLLISGRGCERLVHDIRSRHEAVMVGVNTVITDNPQLTVRHGEGRDPLPVVLDSRLRIPEEAHLLARPGPAPWIATAEEPSHAKGEALARRGAILRYVPSQREGVCLPSVLQTLKKDGCDSVVVEGGGRVLSAFLANDLVDFAVVMVGPMFVGGSGAVRYRVDQPFRLNPMNTSRVDEDFVHWGVPTPVPVSTIPGQLEASTPRDSAVTV